MVKQTAGANGEAKAAERVRVIRPVVRVIEIPIKGFLDVPLVMNKFSEKAMQMMADKQQKKGQGPREAKDPVACFRGAMHLMPGAKAADDYPDVGFPAGGFRKSMIAAANAKTNGVSKNLASGAVFVLGEDKTGLVRIHYDEVRMREDAVRNDSGVADLRYRPEFLGWSATLHIQYDAGLISAEQVVNLAHRAGYSVGIGEGRPEKKGEWGRWEVLTAEDDEAPEPAPDPAAKADRPRRKREAAAV
jgi:hypothetical protein